MRRLLLAAVLAVLAMLMASVITVEAGEVRLPCPPDAPQVMCFADPCRTVTAEQCPYGCVADNCGSCQARCYCRGSLDCPRGGRCRRELDAPLGVCSNLAPTETPAPTLTKSTEVEDEMLKPSFRHGRGGRRHNHGARDLDSTPQKDDESTVDTKCMTVRCAADTKCVEGQCVPRDCTADSDCSENAFCNKESVCQARNSCKEASQCPVQGWYPLIKCMGYFTCIDGECGYKCGKEPVAEPTPPTEDASCAAVLCAADTHCVNGTCVANKCDATNDCSETSYCGSAGTCVPRGTCEEALDCEKDPSFIHIMCAPGVFSCTDRRCGYTCTSTP